MFGKRFFNENMKQVIPQHGVEVWPGYTTSVLLCQSGLLLYINTCNRVLRTATLLDQIQELEVHGKEELIKRKLVGRGVLTKYNNRTYFINNIDFTKTPLSMFTRGPTQESFVQYYGQRWGVHINNLKQPLVLVKQPWQDKEIFLVPELCYLTGLSDEQVSDFSFMKALQATTKKDPGPRLRMC